MKPHKIELYNDLWLHSSTGCGTTSSAIIDRPSNKIDLITFQPHPFPIPVNTNDNYDNITIDVSPTVHFPPAANVKKSVMPDDTPSDKMTIKIQHLLTCR